MSAVLGVYASADAAARGVAGLERLRMPTGRVEVLTDAPYPAGAFGEPPVHHHLLVFPIVGGACGLVVGILLTIGVQLAYPMVQGGKPLLSIPPMINILYEGTLLGAIVMTVAGVVFESRLPDFSGHPYDPRISEGCVGVLVTRVSDRSVEAAIAALREAGALDVILERGP